MLSDSTLKDTSILKEGSENQTHLSCEELVVSIPLQLTKVKTIHSYSKNSIEHPYLSGIATECVIDHYQLMTILTQREST